MFCWWWKWDSEILNDFSPWSTGKWVRVDMKLELGSSDFKLFSPSSHSCLPLWFYLTFIALLEIGKVVYPFFRWPNQNLVLLWKRKVACQKGGAGIRPQVFRIQTPYPLSWIHKLHRSVWILSFFAAEMLMILTYLIPNRTRKGGGSLIVDAVLEREESS